MLILIQFSCCNSICCNHVCYIGINVPVVCMHGFFAYIASSYAHNYVCTPLVRKIGYGQIPQVKQSINQSTTYMTVRLQTMPILNFLFQVLMF